MTRSKSKTAIAGLVSTIVMSYLASPASISFAATGDKPNWGFTQANFGNGWYEVNAKAAKDETAKLGGMLSVVSAAGDPSTQNSQIHTFINKGLNGVIINPTDTQALASSLTALNTADIPFVLVNVAVTPDLVKKSYCYVTEDGSLNASMVGAEMARVLMKKYGPDQTVKLLEVVGFPGDIITKDRGGGFEKGYLSVQGAPKPEFLEPVYGHWQADYATGPVRSRVTATPDLAGIFVGTDSMIPGVRTALQSLNKWGQIPIGGYDGRMSIVKDIADGTGGIIATVANRPETQGQVAADMLKQANDGVPKDTACPGNVHLVSPELVTPANAKSYYNSASDY
jgi:ribose transport system substrate-binding protein